MNNPRHTLPADSLILRRECQRSESTNPCYVNVTVKEFCESNGALECDQEHHSLLLPDNLKSCFDYLVFRLLLNDIVSRQGWSILPDFQELPDNLT